MNRKVVIGGAVALVVLSAIFGINNEENGEDAAPAPEVTATQQQDVRNPEEAAQDAVTQAQEQATPEATKATPEAAEESPQATAAPEELVAFICAGSTDTWGPSLDAVTATAVVPVPNTNGAHYVGIAWTQPDGEEVVGVWDVSTLTSETGVYNVRAVDGFAKQFTEFRDSTRSITDAGAKAVRNAVK